MKIPACLQRRLVWLNLPSVLLISLLQRAPVLRFASGGPALPGASPLSAILRSAWIGAATFGTLHSLAGATQLSTSSPSPLNTTVGATVTIAFAITGTTSGADSWSTGGNVPPGLAFSGLSSETLLLSGKASTPGNYTFSVQAHDAIGGDTQEYSFTIVVAGSVDVAPTITTQPAAQVAAMGASLTLTAAANGTPAPTFQWRRNGRAIAGATAATYTKTNTQPGDAGLYSVVVTNAAGTATSSTVVVGLTSTELLVGSAFSDPAWRTLQHPSGNVYTQILLTGAAATVTADPGKVTRLSYIDLQDDIVQLEFSGSGSMTVTLDNPTGPALPAKYNQAVEYMRGHASVVIAGASANTFFSAFSVGSATAVNQTLFRSDVAYDGHADLARLVIQSPNGQFGGLFMGNAAFNETQGETGLYAPGVSVINNIRTHDLTAFDQARPVLRFGSTPNSDNGVRITGGNLQQPNARAIDLSGVNKVTMGAGTDSHGRAEAAQSSQARFETNGADITNTVVVNPTP